MNESSTVQFENLPITVGPLLQFSKKREAILNDVTRKTAEELLPGSLDFILSEALYSEKYRLKRDKANIFTRGRHQDDFALWNQIQAGLLKPSGEVDRKILLEQAIEHYSQEIGGHFNPLVYRFATRAVPWGFRWLLNAASIRHFSPWGLKESLQSRIHIVGEIPALQKLAQKGTVLLTPTHQSNIDSVLIGYLIYLMSLPPFAYGAGLNLFSNPILSFFMNQLGAYKVDRLKNNLIYKTTLKNYSTRILREGIHSIFFPGGGRSRSGAVESKLKLGLLGTGLEAQLENLKAGNPKPKIFIVPMVMSYHFVLEASSLIEDYLADAGKMRFIILNDESWQAKRVANFFWKFFSAQASVMVRVGKALDIFGNFVDDEGHSIGPNGTTIDPMNWLKSKGELKPDLNRDQEYTRELGSALVTRFHRENTVLTSHLVAFSFFETLRTKYPDLDLYRFVRLSLPQRSLPYSEFLPAAERYLTKVRASADQGLLYLSPELRTSDADVWISDGIKQLGLFHDAAVVKVGEGAIWTEDMTLLYYYRNRLSGYGLSLLAEPGDILMKPGKNDRQGFLA